MVEQVFERFFVIMGPKGLSLCWYVDACYWILSSAKCNTQGKTNSVLERTLIPTYFCFSLYCSWKSFIAGNGESLTRPLRHYTWRTWCKKQSCAENNFTGAGNTLFKIHATSFWNETFRMKPSICFVRPWLPPASNNAAILFQYESTHNPFFENIAFGQFSH
jgi:hypothetical protein